MGRQRLSLAVRGQQMRVLMVTLELADPIFSGNGVYGRTIVEALVSEPGTTVDVLCGSPADTREEAAPFASHATLAKALGDSRLRVGRVPLPVWGKVDRNSAWVAFGDGAVSAPFVATCREPYDLIIGVDWTAARAVASLKKVLPGAPKVVHMNFRVFFAQLELLQDGAADAKFYKAMERYSCGQADIVVALTSADGASLAELMVAPEEGGVHTELSTAILNPPLRSDIAALALHSPPSSRRRFITLCARISEEKRVLEYVGIVTAARSVTQTVWTVHTEAWLTFRLMEQGVVEEGWPRPTAHRGADIARVCRALHRSVSILLFVPASTHCKPNM